MKRLLIFIFSLIPVLMQAQGLTPSEERQIRLKVVDLMEEYEKYSNMDQDFAEFGPSFRALFTSGTCRVYNDLSNVVKGQDMTVSEYIKVLTEQSSTTRATIKNIDCKGVYVEDGVIKIVCSFDKYVNITNDCGVEYSSEFFNATDYHETADIIYDKATKLCLFASISGYVQSIRTIPDEYRILKVDRNLGYSLKCGGKSLDFNAMNQAFIPLVGDVSCDDPDLVVTMKELSAKCNMWSVSVKPRRYRLKPHFDMAMGDMYELDGANNLGAKETSGFNLGLDFGYVFPSRTNTKVGLFAGLGITNSSIDLDYHNNGLYSYNASGSADVDGDSYTRRYSDLNLKQTYKLTDLTVPVYLDIEMHLSPIVSFAVDLGAQVHVNMSNKVENTTGSAYVDGIYPQYANLVLNESWGYNKFGNNTYSNADLEKSELAKVNSFTADVFGRAGLRISIPKTPLAIDLGAQYVYGIMDVMTGGNVSYSNPATETAALIYNTTNGQNSTEHIRNLADGLKSIKRQGLRIHAGIVYKF